MNARISSASINVLLIDDDVELAGLVSALFAREGISIRHAARGGEGLAVFEEAIEPPALVLLDLMLPDTSGIDVFRALRARLPRLPVIMLTARGDPIDRVVGLELGADDYVSKPFDPRELVARVRSVLRRAAMSDAALDAGNTRRAFGCAVLDLGAGTLSAHDRQISLTTIELRLLAEFVNHPGAPRSRDALTKAAQIGNYRPLERAVDVQIARLRKKLRSADASAGWIVAVRGEGYRWAPPGAA